ncbi:MULTISPECIES: ABC transporter ATP-binding protein [unclassified Clostridium]|uniref:ABC transporter ATP-binding protein n=1 Tax=Clostridium TaxID=1485 RepID=UPI001C8B8A6D|nr:MULTISPECIES: ABC transporter ATP-binding protein [unclassified Clostridium]MBX9137877.1 ABC transporter ATP-binding protein [Clostridium sp. K12(2020)]MBX9143466.1 ABC transporter ATP-binding protein [Clostridium sp. K13]MDU2288519.1 ABC transporter ATP-binding protein [Clostridium celatum]MDU4324082.1 ABC transporter ATP-binding protein [Clostridium celatum]
MLKLLKHLKPFIGSFIIAIALLFVQAICDLSLPDYMSDIVNVGIQQGGVENAVPKVIQSSELDKLFIFMSDDDKNVIMDDYELLNKETLSSDEYNNYLNQYPELENEDLYKLNVKGEEKIDKLNSIFSKPMLIVYMLETEGLKGVSNDGNMMTEMIQLPAGVDLSTMDTFEVLKMMSKDQINQMLSSIDEKLDSMPESMITQSATSYVKLQYKNIGINIDKLQSNYVILAGAKMVGIALISMLATVIVSFIAARVGAALGRNLRKDVFNKVVGFSNSEFDEFSTASLITRTTNDIQQIIMLVVMGLRVVFYAPILGVGGVLKVINTGASMGWVIGVAVISILLLVIVLFSFAMPKFKSVQKLVDRLNLVTRESLTGMLVIRAFSTQKYEEDKFEVANKNLTRTNLFVNRIMTTMMPLMMFIMNAITLLIVWVGAHRIDEGIMQVGTMMAFMQYTMQIIMAFLMISMVSVILPRAMVSAQRVSEVLQVDVSIKDIEKTQMFNAQEKGTIEFKNVSFRYPGADEDVIHDVSFKALPGETTAFIGSTGSGKSTLINLIPRFYDATQGEILIDGVNIKNVSQHDLREKIGFIPQKGLLFSGTIESNLKYGGENITDEDMIKASEIAQAMEFISSKEERFNTEIAQGGTNVSGGQKQRLAIARAIAKKPEIFVFDDSFSALDFKTDANLRKAINTELNESTLLIVAQRISTIMGANQIIVLDEGKVVGKGTHKELMENCEVYQQIALSQLSKEELSNE